MKRLLPFLWAAVLMAIAFTVAWRTTHDLAWPNEHDLYRDMASAQSLLTEGFGRDPVYVGERVWYNPLTHIAMAAAHVVSGLPLPETVARCGAYLNLLGPICFFLLAVRLLDRTSAVLALISYLFCIGGSFPSWAAATYSPWLYPVNFAQGFFYLLMGQLVALRDRKPGPLWAVATGALWGFTFLAHTAPALLFGAIMVYIVLAHVWRARRPSGADLRGAAITAAVMGATFLIVIAPFAASILGHYRLHIANPVPNAYFPSFLGYRAIPEMILRHLDLPVLVAWYGLYLLVRGRCTPFVRTMFLPWVVVTAAYLLYGYVVAGFLKFGIRLPLIIPSYHALFYFKASLSILFAIGLTSLVNSVARRLPAHSSAALDLWKRGAAKIAALAIAAFEIPFYTSRYDYAQARAEALAHGAETSRIAVYAWLRANARPDDVVLASDDLGIFCVAPAGAKTVAVDPYLSSPYVPWRPRDDARDAMFAALRDGRADDVVRLARDWRVTLVADETDGAAIAPSLLESTLHQVLASGPIRLYRIHPPGTP